MMNIIYVFDRKIIPSNGGVERVTSLLAEGLSERGHSIQYLSVGPPERNTDDTLTGFPQTYIPSDSIDFDEQIGNFFKDQNPDAVVVQGADNYVVRILPLIPEGVKRILVYHLNPFTEIPYERFIRKIMFPQNLPRKEKLKRLLALALPPLYRRLYVKKTADRLRSIVSKVDHLVLLSERFIPKLLKYAPGIDPTKVGAINNPLTFQVKEDSAGEKENVVLFVARLANGQKNVTGFIDAWKKFHQFHPDWKAYIVGQGPDEKQIKAYAAKRGVQGLEFTGNVADVSEYYHGAKILCMTSTLEGWGMVLTEAMAYGCVPVAFSSYEAIHDIIHSGENGLLVEPFRTDEMASAMGRLADDEDLRLRLAASGREKIKDFEGNNIAEQWERLLKGQ